MRLWSGTHALIDMDASALIGKENAGEKVTSSGCWPPELAEAVLNKVLIPASQAIDVKHTFPVVNHC